MITSIIVALIVIAGIAVVTGHGADTRDPDYGVGPLMAPGLRRRVADFHRAGVAATRRARLAHIESFGHLEPEPSDVSLAWDRGRTGAADASDRASRPAARCA